MNRKEFLAIAAVAIARKKAKPQPDLEKALTSLLGRKKRVLEKHIEDKVRLYAIERGCLCDKFTSPSKRSVPDRIIITPGGQVGFLEMKKPGNEPTKQQYSEMKKLRDRGCIVRWADNFESAKRFIDFLICIE